MKKLQEQQSVRPGLLIAVAAVGVAAVAFFLVNMLIGGGGGGGGSSDGSAAAITQPSVAPIPNLNIPTAPPAPPGTGRDPFVPVAGAGATPAPVAPAETPIPATPRERAREAIETPAPAGEFQSSTGTKQYVEVIAVSADRKIAQIRNGTIVYEQARPGMVLDRGVVIDSIDASGCVHLHRGTTRTVLCKGNKALM